MRDTFFLDLRDQVRVIDFLVEHLEYASGKEKTKAEELIQTYQDGTHIPTDKLADAARKFAITVWTTRYALSRFFEGEGSEIEWSKIMATIRPSTAHLLDRVKKSTRASTLDGVLRHAESEVALQEGERIEISEIRKHIRHAYWQEHQKSLAPLAKEGEQRLKFSLGALKTLRDIALDLPQSMQDEVFSKIAHFEDKIFFEGETVPQETFEEETKYYTEQKEISPLEE